MFLEDEQPTDRATSIWMLENDRDVQITLFDKEDSLRMMFTDGSRVYVDVESGFAAQRS